MRWVGFFIMMLGIALLLFLTRNYFLQQDEITSPIPETEGVKVIIVTPQL